MTEQTIQILIVDALPEDGSALRRAITQEDPHAQVTVVYRAMEAADLIRENRYDLILVDRQVDDLVSLDVFPLIEQTPVILMLGLDNEGTPLPTGRRGTYDYIIKDAARQYMTLLPKRIRNALDSKAAHDALRESEARYQDLFDHAPDLYLLVNVEGTVESINLSGAERLGWQPVEIVGRAMEHLVHPDDWDWVRREVRRTFEQPDLLHQMEFRLSHRDGDIYLVSARMSVQQHPSVGQPGLRMICRDITAERAALKREQDLRDRLVRAERLESLAILAGGVAHDLNNVLMPLVAYPDLLLADLPQDSLARQDVEEIRDGAQAVSDIVKDLQTMARRRRCERNTIQLNDVVTAFGRSVVKRDLAQRYRSVSLTMDLAPDLWTLAGSVPHLNKLLVNLVINGCEALPCGGTLHIATQNVSFDEPVHGCETIPEGRYVALTVSDSGRGIAREDWPRLFEPFYSKKKLGRSGPGLGLSVVYGVLKDHDGFVDVRSDDQTGTQLTFYFPMDEAEPETRNR